MCGASADEGGGVDGLVLDHLGNAIQHGRQPVLIAPAPCIDALRASGRATDAILLSFCRHDVFRQHLLDAEHAFYWNVFSNSILARVMNGLPVLFLARPHGPRHAAALRGRAPTLLFRLRIALP